jgi:hypothetical protein
MAATTIACDPKDATGLPRGDSRWLLDWRHGYSAVSSVNLRRGKPVASFGSHAIVVAAIVNLRRDKPVASLEFRSLIAGRVRFVSSSFMRSVATMK